MQGLRPIYPSCATWLPRANPLADEYRQYTNDMPAVLYSGEGLCLIIFMKLKRISRSDSPLPQPSCLHFCVHKLTMKFFQIRILLFLGGSSTLPVHKYKCLDKVQRKKSDMNSCHYSQGKQVRSLFQSHTKLSEGRRGLHQARCSPRELLLPCCRVKGLLAS